MWPNLLSISVSRDCIGNWRQFFCCCISQICVIVLEGHTTDHHHHRHQDNNVIGVKSLTGRQFKICLPVSSLLLPL